MNEERLTDKELELIYTLVNSHIIPPTSDKGKMVLELIANRPALLAAQKRVAELEGENAKFKSINKKLFAQREKLRELVGKEAK